MQKKVFTRIFKYTLLLYLCLMPQVFAQNAKSMPNMVELKTLPTTTLKVGDAVFVAEVASTPAARSQGLMYRGELPDNHAMLFIFEKPARQSFWMKNTFIPLDILFFDQQGILQTIHRSAMPCQDPTGRRCPSYPSKSEALFVVEINAGLTEKLGIELGAKLSFELP